MKKNVEDIFRSHGGQLRMSEAIRLGISRYALYTMVEYGTLVQISRGVYRLADLPLIGHPDVVTIASRYPKAVICLISALDYYELTTQIPHRVHIAILEGSRTPSITYPPIQVFRYSGATFQIGVETHTIDGVPVKIYGPEKTIVDCFKFRNKIGMDIVLEALKLYRQRHDFYPAALISYARTCRVEKVITPYIEAIL